jgi:uncharacterized protein (TIGR00299 family) protein
MRILYFDCFAGISGDMTVGALISAGLPLEYLKQELQNLPLNGYTINTRLIERSMISAVKFDVITNPEHQGNAHSHEHGHTEDHHHPHIGEHRHSHEHSHSNSEDHSHEQLETHVHTHGLSFREIKDLIEQSGLSPKVKFLSVAIYRSIAVAEARIHNLDLETVHFHEVGAIDSIVDIVSTAIGLDYFGIDECRSRAVPLGSGGMVRTAHGLMPIPTPATLDILKDCAIEPGVVASEMTTPTGAGIIKATYGGKLHANEILKPIAIGYGAGTKQFAEIPNLLRIVVGELEAIDIDIDSNASAFPETDSILQLTTAIDDMTAQNLSYLQEQILKLGALDAYLRPIVMKKGRAAHELIILSKSELLERILSLLAEECTTLGVRVETLQRRLARREIVYVEHPIFGKIQMKAVAHNRSNSRLLPEFDEVRRLAEQNGMTLKTVYSLLSEKL